MRVAEQSGSSSRRRGQVEMGSLLLTTAVAFFLVGGCTGMVTFLSADRLGDRNVVQPVAFNHRQHVEGQGLGCTDCHLGPETEVHSGLPPLEGCVLCHGAPQGESAEEARLVQMIADGEEITWGRVFREPPHVFFSHRRHVTVAGLECAGCHGDIGASETPPTWKTPLQMEECIQCHEERDVTTSCAACHR